MRVAYLRQYAPGCMIVQGDFMSKTSAAVKNRYNAKVYDRFQIYLPKGYKDRLRAIVGEGGSITNYIKEAIDAKMKEEQA